MTAPETLIEVERVTKTFGAGGAAVQALTNVTLAVYPGEVTLLMGPSGSGKTTLLSIMGCILSPTSGRVSVGGRETTSLSESERARLRLGRIGFVFQAYNLFPTLTASENVRVAFTLQGLDATEAKQRAEQVLGEVGLSDKLETFPRDLSGGQKQRVAIARALAGAHDIILADEPTGALDSQSGRTVLGLLRNLAHRRGYAVVVVTHDPRAFPFVDRVVTMEDGRIIADERGGGPGSPVPMADA